MFTINQIVVKKDSGVYLIEKQETIDLGLGEQEYLILSPYYKKNRGVVYIPTSNVNDFLRNPITEDEARDIINSIPSLERIWFNDPKIRKNEFDNLIKSGDLKKCCQVIKSIYLQGEDLRQIKKTLSTNDRYIYDRVKDAIDEELAYALKINVEDVENYVLSTF